MMHILRLVALPLLTTRAWFLFIFITNCVFRLWFVVLMTDGLLSPPLVDSCKKMGLVFDDVVGIVEIINCRDVKIQVRAHFYPLSLIL